MRLKNLAVLAVVALLSIAAGNPAARNWNTAVQVTPSGSHVLGNPAAPTKITEYMSYTCPHCAHFEREAGDPIRVYFIMPGKASLEIRHLVRDPVDLTVAMLTNCGPPSKFFLNHAMFLRGQDRWIAAGNGASAAQQARWTSGPPAARRLAIARDYGFFAIMESRGYDRITAERCLADEAMARRLAQQTSEAQKLSVESTPSFLLNGVLLAGTYDWKSLQAQLKARN